MSGINERLGQDTQFRQRLMLALDRYRARRDAHELIEDAGAPPGGDSTRVKCLHSHTAHELADSGNPVGALTLAAAGWPDCRVPCFAPAPGGGMEDAAAGGMA